MATRQTTKQDGYGTLWTQTMDSQALDMTARVGPLVPHFGAIIRKCQASWQCLGASTISIQRRPKSAKSQREFSPKGALALGKFPLVFNRSQASAFRGADRQRKKCRRIKPAPPSLDPTEFMRDWPKINILVTLATPGSRAATAGKYLPAKMFQWASRLSAIHAHDDLHR